jgi:hypothetical protein
LAYDSEVNFSPTPTRVRVTCENCQKPIELDCEGLAGPAGYETYNEFFCPHCNGLCRARTPGTILTVHKAGDTA